MGSATPRFAADAMLGRLAKWLRLLGFDTVYDPSLRGSRLLQRAAREGRILLTRDTRLLQRRDVPQHLFIEADDFRSQLRQVVTAFGIDPRAASFQRCARCNSALEEAAAAAVRDRVPPYVLATQAQFFHCPACDRVYWAATHVERIRAELERLSTSECAT